jgi:hypothetical protein
MLARFAQFRTIMRFGVLQSRRQVSQTVGPHNKGRFQFKVNIVIAGPCGVGKSKVAKSFAHQTRKKYLDFDELGIADMVKRKVGISPFSSSRLNLKQCLPPILDTISIGFVLDIGGDTVFRPRADNDDRLMQILWLKKTYSAQIVVLTARKDILFERFIASKNRNASEFDETWMDWVTVGKPYWQRCVDLLVDTSLLATDDTSRQIEEMLKI